MSILDIDIGLNPSIMTPKQGLDIFRLQTANSLLTLGATGGFKIGRNPAVQKS